MSYDRYLQGGYGPFVFGQSYESASGTMKFSVTVQNSNIIISLPGTQLIGYLCDIVPQHPAESGERSRRRRFTRKADFERKELDKFPSKFNEWLSSRSKADIDPGHPTELEGVAAILPSTTLASYDLNQQDMYANTSVDYRMLKTDSVN